LGCLLSRFTGRVHLSTCHGFFKQRFSRRAFPCWGQKVIAISESVKEHLIQDFRVNAAAVSIIHNGIDIDRFASHDTKRKEEMKKSFRLSAGPVVGIVARLSDVKGHIYLIEAMKAVVEKIPQAQLLIAGDGKLKKELTRRVNTLGISKNVLFITEAVDTKDMLAAMDLFVLPSLKEGLGLALMEAMASGLAVIGSSVGGIKTLINDGYNGILVKPADTKGLALAILELLRDERKRTSLGKEARIFISQNFSQEKMVSETERIYLECLNAKG